ncbi:MAG: kinase 1 [Candidatus Woesearchaeota archaeon]|nr:kinase 1 [Candidatus Woesearchaeota archaeon]MDN5327631.1 kinase 1 [Candidatus Woesearchaeota archaeon]
MASPEKFKTYNDVFDNFTIRLLNKVFETLNLREPDVVPISIGKEANVFKLQENEDVFALKIYRLETCDFTKMDFYLRNDNRISIKTKKRREIIFYWAKREFLNLQKVKELNINAPLPLTQKNNILVMSFIGNEWPSPKLKDYSFESKTELEKIFLKTFDFVKKLKENNLVHGDLSEYNILVKNSEPYFIDFSHATPLNTSLGIELLTRDLKNLAKFFIKQGIEKEKVNKKIKQILN